MKKQKIVITGGPGTGKSSIIRQLEKHGHECLHEISRQVTLEAQKQGIGKKQLKNLREEMEIESNKTDFKGGWEISLPDSKNIQEPEGAQDDL